MNIAYFLKATTLWMCLKWILPLTAEVELEWLPSLEVWLLWAYTIVSTSRLINAVFTLKTLPGPLAWVTSDGPRMILTLWGYYREQLLDLHHRYGKVVRVGTKTLSFNTLIAAKDIYERGTAIFIKDPRLYFRSKSGEYDIVCTPSAEEHAGYLQDYGPAFNDTAIMEQEALVQSHVNHFVSKLKAAARPKTIEAGTVPTAVVDMQKRLALLTADIAEDLLVGSTRIFDPDAVSTAGDMGTAVENKKLPQWIDNCRQLLRKPFDMFWMIDVLGISAEQGRTLAQYLYPRSRVLVTRGFNALVSKIRDRYTVGVDKSDWLTPIIRQFIENPPQTQEQRDLTLQQVQANVTMLHLFGSETTVSTLSGVFSFLASHSDVLSKLTTEIRTRCSRDDKITFAKLAKLHYLNAVIEETLRLYPPIPMGLPRVARVDTVVDGVPVSRGMTVSVNPFVLSRSPSYFAKPLQFAPERWLSPTPAAFANDVLDASIPFSLGPRGCIARRFAHAEMRLVIAKILWHFDVEAVNGVERWVEDQRSWYAWERGPLRLRLSLRQFGGAAPQAGSEG